MHLFIRLFLFTFFFALYSSVPANPSDQDDDKASEWAENLLRTLSPDEKIGQLFMVAAYSNRDKQHEDETENLIKNYHIGGLIFFQGGPVRQAVLTNRYQAAAKLPLLIGIDGEWGLSMRLDSTTNFPKQMTLGAIRDPQLIYKMGKEIGRQCKRLGIHINFAPDVDVNNNPNNPVIGNRSFGENKYKVVERGMAYMLGLQDEGVMAVAKHFPGHGDTDSDSHETLPVINHSRERMDSIELYPFKELIKSNVGGVMVAHLYLPAYDKTPRRASTLSPLIVKELLKTQLGFKGLVFTDALNMKGVSKYYKPGEADLSALLAGNDVLLFPENVPKAVSEIKKALDNGQLSQAELDEKVRKILLAKYQAGLFNYSPIELRGLVEDLNDNKGESLREMLYMRAATTVKNVDHFLPIRDQDTLRFASIDINGKENDEFQRFLNKYAPFSHFKISDKSTSNKVFDETAAQIDSSAYNTVVIAIRPTNNSRKNYGLSENVLNFIRRLQKTKKVILVSFGNPYALENFTLCDYILCMYEDNEITRRVAPQVIFGALGTDAQLPVASGPTFKEGDGLVLMPLNRLRYTRPESVGMRKDVLDDVDRIATKAISEKATPGCRVLVAKDGAVVFDKSYGYLSYDKKEPVTEETIYDIASVTKVAGTLQAVMFLTERGLIDPDERLSYYLPELIGTNKANLTIRNILLHQAGLQAFIPYWVTTMADETSKERYYCHVKDDWFRNEVTPSLFSSADMEDVVWERTVNSPISTEKNKYGRSAYKYSDLTFYFMKRLVERLTNQPINDFLAQNFYEPLGLTTLMYNPLHKFPISQIAPTEDDKYFRKELIRGTVHDPGAAMIGGIAGHAGIFSNANDLAVLMQMNLSNGEYGGRCYFNENTITKFTAKQTLDNRRGLGWDKPAAKGEDGPTSDAASPRTFGHTGFTGTCVWVDPEYNLIYIFLSNRIHPSAENNKLTSTSVRTKIHDIIYKSIIHP